MGATPPPSVGTGRRLGAAEEETEPADYGEPLEVIARAVKLRLGSLSAASRGHSRRMLDALARIRHGSPEAAAGVKLIGSAAMRILGDAQDAVRAVHAGRVPPHAVARFSLHVMSELHVLAAVFAGSTDWKAVYARACELIELIRCTCLI